MTEYYQGSKVEIDREVLLQLLEDCRPGCKIVLLVGNEGFKINDHMSSCDGLELCLYTEYEPFQVWDEKGNPTI